MWGSVSLVEATRAGYLERYSFPVLVDRLLNLDFGWIYFLVGDLGVAWMDRTFFLWRVSESERKSREM